MVKGRNHNHHQEENLKKIQEDVSVKGLQKLIAQGNPQQRKIAETQFEIVCMNIEIHALQKQLKTILAVRTQKEAHLKELLQSERSHSAPPTIFCKKSLKLHKLHTIYR